MTTRKRCLALVLAATMAATTGGCRAVFLSHDQDVFVQGPPGSTFFVDGAPAYPGTHRLARDRDHTITTDWGWSQKIDSSFHWTFVLWALTLSGLFEFLDFTNGTAYALSPAEVTIPPRTTAGALGKPVSTESPARVDEERPIESSVQ